MVAAACWTHTRRCFHEELQATGSPPARQAIELMQPLFAITAKFHCQPPEARHAARQARSALGQAICDTLAQRGALTTVLRDDRALLAAARTPPFAGSLTVDAQRCSIVG